MEVIELLCVSRWNGSCRTLHCRLEIVPSDWTSFAFYRVSPPSFVLNISYEGYPDRGLRCRRDQDPHRVGMRHLRQTAHSNSLVDCPVVVPRYFPYLCKPGTHEAGVWARFSTAVNLTPYAPVSGTNRGRGVFHSILAIELVSTQPIFGMWVSILCGRSWVLPCMA